MSVLRKAHMRQKPTGSANPAAQAVETWRYLRLAMVGLVAGLAASVLYEHAETGSSCWQTSISGYYYTPVQNFLVGALVTIGVCLVAVKGNTDWEDTLLNLAGVCAPVVAFVPIPDTGHCGSALTGTANRDLNIGNNVTALLVVGWLALLVLAALSWRGRWRSEDSGDGLSRTARMGFWVTVALYAGTTVVFVLERAWFTDWGHPVAATAMFVFILANVWLNAVNLYFTRRDAGRPVRALNRYSLIGALMVLAAAGWGLVALTHWPYWLLGIESSLIVLFAVFWVLQTIELWHPGLRRRPPETVRRATGDHGERRVPEPLEQPTPAADG